jgi:hypothetical protein
MYKVIVSAILTLTLFGCGQEFQSYQFTKERFTKQSGVAIIDFRRKGVTLDLIKFANADGSRYKILDDSGYYRHAYHIDLSFIDSLWLGDTDPYVLLMEPGFYAFNNMSFTEDYGSFSTIYYTAAATTLINQSVDSFIARHGAFYVPPGETVYIGDIGIGYKLGAFQFGHVYNDDKISDFLKKKYPPLVDKVRRGEYFAGGAEYYYKDIINMTN